MISATPNSTDSCHDADMAMQKYLELQSLHEELVQYLDPIRYPSRTRTWSSTMSPASYGTSPSPSPSPTDSAILSFPSPCRSRSHRSHLSPRSANTTSSSSTTSSTSSLDTVWDEDMLGELEAKEQRLSGVNEDIKRALTELLNCRVVWDDCQLRMWVQRRLMETEKELRSGRRKRSAF